MTAPNASTHLAGGTLHARRGWIVPSSPSAADKAGALARLLASMELDALISTCQPVVVKLGSDFVDFNLVRALCDRLFSSLGRVGSVVVTGRRNELAGLMDWPAEYASKGLWLSTVELGRTGGAFRRCSVGLGADALHRVGRSDGQGMVSREFVVAGDLLAARLVVSIAAGNALAAMADIEAAAPEKGQASGGWPAILDKNRILLYADSRGSLCEEVQRTVIALTVRPDCLVASLNPLVAAVVESRLQGGSLTAAATAFGLVRYPLAAFDRTEIDVAGWPKERAA